MVKSAKPSPKQIAAQKDLDRLAAIDAKCRNYFDERDQIEGRLIDTLQGLKAGSMLLPGGTEVFLKDNFADRDGNPRNVAFKTAAVKRFEIATRNV